MAFLSVSQPVIVAVAIPGYLITYRYLRSFWLCLCDRLTRTNLHLTVPSPQFSSQSPKSIALAPVVPNDDIPAIFVELLAVGGAALGLLAVVEDELSAVGNGQVAGQDLRVEVLERGKRESQHCNRRYGGKVRNSRHCTSKWQLRSCSSPDRRRRGQDPRWEYRRRCRGTRCPA